ncbi:MAG: PAS domain-containing protein [Prolixibacteraceae bacterium]|nr:PAS domain-containing protein [Prolixibacteraceae bacterium]
MIIRDNTGIDFSFYKENTITRRLERRVSINRFDGLDEYVQFLINSDKEKEILYNEFLIGVTQFFRDKEAFKSLYENVIESLTDNEKSQIRVWATGCSTGEEAYSVAILFREAAEKKGYKGEIKIFATDLDRRAIEIAGRGIYSESIVADVDTYLLRKYFHKNEGGFKINEEVRNMIVFASHNLLKDPPFSKLDLLICRNLFIYLKPDIQLSLLSRFYHSLNKKGYLFMGSSETLGVMDDAFSVVDMKNKIFKYRPGFSAPLVDGLALEIKKNKVPGERNTDLSANNRALKSNELLGSVIDEFIPPSIIVDSNYFIVSVINNINPFIEIQAGNYSNELFSILPRDMGLFVNNLVRVLRNSNENYSNRIISGLNSLGDKTVNIEARKLFQGEKKFYMLSFSVVDKKITPDADKKEIDDFDYSSEQGNRVTELENELSSVKESLAATVEELESANEELQSSNEELIASNEELQSTNEELQSVNEELYTVNSEHQQKIEELTRLNSDVNNLLKNTDVAAIYLDSKLCIRKITPQVSSVTNILETDIGRPVTHLTLMDTYPEFENDVNAVLENLQPVDKEITDKKGLPMFVRLRPYRTSNNAVDGVMVTLIDISGLYEREKLLRLVLEESPVTTIMVDHEGWIVYANKKAEVLFNINKQEIMKRSYDASEWEISDPEGKPVDSSKLPFAIIKKTGKPLYGFKHFIKIPKREKILLTIDGVPVYMANDEFKGVVFTIKVNENE